MWVALGFVCLHKQLAEGSVAMDAILAEAQNAAAVDLVTNGAYFQILGGTRPRGTLANSKMFPGRAGPL